MGSQWGDEFDEELKKDNRIKVGFVFNYMQISKILSKIEEETREWDDKYPKNELIKIWCSVLVMITILFTLSHSILIAATGLFFFFFGHTLVQIYKTWKRFNYSKAQYLLMTVGALVVSFLIGSFFRNLIFK